MSTFTLTDSKKAQQPGIFRLPIITYKSQPPLQVVLTNSTVWQVLIELFPHKGAGGPGGECYTTCVCTKRHFSGRKPGYTQSSMQILNPSKSANPVMNKLQILLI